MLYNQYGGRILVEYPETESSSRSWRSRTGASLARYIVKDANGNVKRILVMNEDGRVFEERTGPRDDTRNQRNDNPLLEISKLKQKIEELNFDELPLQQVIFRLKSDSVIPDTDLIRNYGGQET